MRGGTVCNGRVMGRGGSGERSIGTTNASRVEWALAALGAYAPLVYGRPFGELQSDDRATCLADLLADLIHLCRRDGIDFEGRLESARRHAKFEARFAWNEPTE